MCLGLPMRVAGLEGPNIAVCEHAGALCLIDTTLVDAVAVGDWLMTFLGAAREKMGETQAHRSLAALAALDAVMAGGEADIDAAFADIAAARSRILEQLPEDNRQQ